MIQFCRVFLYAIVRQKLKLIKRNLKGLSHAYKLKPNYIILYLYKIDILIA